mmetsp:Transcript_8840/g.25695  ORF Transcript_8840/g.25695 Transcript_8840/m.25695 type:complete len:590 (+) Transcript_8840:457-2226(+)
MALRWLSFSVRMLLIVFLYLFCVASMSRSTSPTCVRHTSVSWRIWSRSFWSMRSTLRRSCVRFSMLAFDSSTTLSYLICSSSAMRFASSRSSCARRARSRCSCSDERRSCTCEVPLRSSSLQRCSSDSFMCRSECASSSRFTFVPRILLRSSVRDSASRARRFIFDSKSRARSSAPRLPSRRPRISEFRRWISTCAASSALMASCSSRPAAAEECLIFSSSFRSAASCVMLLALSSSSSSCSAAMSRLFLFSATTIVSFSSWASATEPCSAESSSDSASFCVCRSTVWFAADFLAIFTSCSSSLTFSRSSSLDFWCASSRSCSFQFMLLSSSRSSIFSTLNSFTRRSRERTSSSRLATFSTDACSRFCASRSSVLSLSASWRFSRLSVSSSIMRRCSWSNSWPTRLRSFMKDRVRDSSRSCISRSRSCTFSRRSSISRCARWAIAFCSVSSLSRRSSSACSVCASPWKWFTCWPRASLVLSSSPSSCVRCSVSSCSLSMVSLSFIACSFSRVTAAEARLSFSLETSMSAWLARSRSSMAMRTTSASSFVRCCSASSCSCSRPSSPALNSARSEIFSYSSFQRLASDSML